jgi:ABC-2 type transport system ATP-binding protein
VQAIKPYGKFNWNEVSPSLEDVFIQLMGRKTDDRYTQ